MMEHNDLAKEMQHIDKLPVTERIALAKKRRKQQLATYSKWAKIDNYNNRKSKSSKNGGIRFSSEVQLLETAARAATDKGATDEMRAILKAGINPNQMNHDGLTALHQSCIDGSVEMVNLLLKAGADVNVVDRDLWTPLHAAATCGHFKIVTMLIRAGANIIAINGDGDLPYDITEDEVTQHYLENEMTKRGITQELITRARQATHDKMKNDIEYLFEHGGNINQPLDQGGTLLHTAIANGFNDLIVKLLENGADSRVRDEDGWEPIHVAAYWCNDSALEILAEIKEVNLRALTDNGETPCDLCDDPELRISILQMISDRPEQYKFGEVIMDTNVPVTEDSWEMNNEKDEMMADDNDQHEITSINLNLNSNNINHIDMGQKDNARRQSSDEEHPLNPLLNLQATELSERRSSVKEAKHMAPLKRMNSIEIVNKSKISPYAMPSQPTHTNDINQNTKTGKMKEIEAHQPPVRNKEQESLEEMKEQRPPENVHSYQEQSNTVNNNYVSSQQIKSKKTLEKVHINKNNIPPTRDNPIQHPSDNVSSQQVKSTKALENKLIYKDNIPPIRDNTMQQPFDKTSKAHSNNENGKKPTFPVSLFQDKKENEKEVNSKKYIHIPRKKNPAPPLPEGSSLLQLKRQRQEARENMPDTVVAEEKSSTSDTLYGGSQFYNPPPSPTMIRYHFKMIPDEVEVVGEAFIKERKCIIM